MQNRTEEEFRGAILKTGCGAPGMDTRGVHGPGKTSRGLIQRLRRHPYNFSVHLWRFRGPLRHF